MKADHSFLPFYIGFFLLISSGCSNTFLAEVKRIPTQSFDGQVADATTGSPIEGATLYLNETEFRDETDENGHVDIEHLPEGIYEILILAPGYYNHYESVHLYDGMTNDEERSRFELVSVDSNLNNLPDNPEKAVQVLQERVRTLRRQLSRNDFTFNQQWVDNLESFQRYFLGSQRAGDISILNPQSINFHVDPGKQGHLLSANSSSNLLIVNNVLGYRIEMVIDTLIIQRNALGIDMQYQGISNFSEIETSSIEQIEGWEKNRQEAFNGSFRHFLMTLPAGKMHSEGFEMFSGVDVQGPQMMGSAERSVNERGIFENTVLRPGKRSYEYHLLPPGELTVTHRDQVPKSKNPFALTSWDMKRSFIKIDSDSLYFNSNGFVMNPKDMRMSGYWRYQQVIEMLPQYYNPAVPHPALN